MENLKLRDFLDYNYLSSIEVSPDKKNTAFIVHRGDYDDNDYKSNIWVMNNETKKYFRLTGMNEERSFLWLDETKILFPSMRDKKLKVKKEKKRSKKEDKTMKKIMHIEGMMCGHCEAAVKKALEALPQVDEAVVSHEAGTAELTLNAEIADDVLKKTVEDKDYTVTSVE